MAPPAEPGSGDNRPSGATDNRPSRHRQNNSSSVPPIDPNLLLKVGAKQIISLFIPVSICMLTVSIVAKTVPYFSTTDVYLIYTPFNTPNADVGTQTWQTLANVGIFLGIVVFMTFLLVILFKYKCYKCLNVWLILTTFILLFFVSFMFFTELIRTSFGFFDNITFAVLLWNFGILGIISIHWRSPLVVQQAFLIFNSCQLALIFLKYLPKWTCWVLLGALAIWDLVAVLCPRGPLRMLVQMAHERERPLLPAMIYSTTSAYLVTNTTSQEPLVFTDNQRFEAPKNSSPLPELSPLIEETRASTSFGFQGTSLVEPFDAEDQKQNSKRKRSIVDIDLANGGRMPFVPENDPTETITPPCVTIADEHTPTRSNTNVHSNRWRNLQEDVVDRQKEGVKLGLGDFIFYSLLIGRAALDGDMLTIVACYIAILVGMCLTIVALGIAGKALPALPISITCGIIFYFSTAAVITPFIDATSQKRIYF